MTYEVRGKDLETFLMIETVSSRHICYRNEGILLYLKTRKKLVTFGKNTKIDAR